LRDQPVIYFSEQKRKLYKFLRTKNMMVQHPACGGVSHSPTSPGCKILNAKIQFSG